MRKSIFAAALGAASILFAQLIAPPALAQLTQAGSKVVPSNPNFPTYGKAVAISGDGTTAIVGGPLDDNFEGAVWIYTRSEATWTEQQKLTGAANQQFGKAVAISADGNTAVIGSNGRGAWVYTRSGGVWTEQAALVPNDSTGSVTEGNAVAISGDGLTAAVSAYRDGGGGFPPGALWVYVRSGNNWDQQGAKLTAASRELGLSVGLSGDGNTLVGAGTDTNQIPTAWIYTRDNGTWTATAGPLTGNDAVGGSNQGISVAMSDDGLTAILGGAGDASFLGAAWIFTFDGTNWAQQGAKLTPSDAAGPAPVFGWSVALSADGNVAAIGGADDNSASGFGTGHGATWSFTRDGGVWSQQGAKLVGTGEQSALVGPMQIEVWSAQGSAVGLTHTGALLITGGPSDNGSVGAFWTFSSEPSVTSVNPATGPATGGTLVTILGANLDGASVTFGGATATINAASATELNVVTPAHAAGVVDVVVTASGGTATAVAAFTYAAPPSISGISPNVGPAGGGTSVTITGSALIGVNDVKFGATAAASFTVDSDSQITAVSPAGSAGAVDITATNPVGTSANTSADDFTYVAAPVVTSISPTSGPIGGGTTVIITGTNLNGVSDVEFGSQNAVSFTPLSNTSVSAVTPAGTGSVAVRVSTPGGTHDSSVMFTYVAPPTITAINPNQGPVSGGTLVSIVGTNLSGATNVRFGNTAATSFSASSATAATATAPPRAAGAVNVTITTPGGTSTASAAARFTYTPAPVMKMIADFAGGRTDGGKPFGALVADKNGALYGTTSMGGARNKGVIFKLVPKANPNALWTKTILHHFDGDDGAKPYAGVVIDNAGNLYGTTTMGGPHNRGVVFKYTAASKRLTVLYSFKGSATDGGEPYAGLARDAQGVLYGFTSEGGRHDFGTAFEIATATNNRFSVSHHFTGATGENPRGAPVLDKQRNVYGATVDGAGPENGLVFKIAPNNTRTTLYTFKAANSDGHHPYGPLFTPGNNGAMFFGTTLQGGAQNKGAVFDVMPPSTGIMLYAFTGASGANPYGGVVADAQTVLYGTTFNGGAQNKGVVFKLSPPANNQPNWTQQLLYSFKGGAADGANPYAGVVLGTNRTLYGTTSAGGGGACTGGCGNVFKVTY